MYVDRPSFVITMKPVVMKKPVDKHHRHHSLLLLLSMLSPPLPPSVTLPGPFPCHWHHQPHHQQLHQRKQKQKQKQKRSSNPHRRRLRSQRQLCFFGQLRQLLLRRLLLLLLLLLLWTVHRQPPLQCLMMCLRIYPQQRRPRR